jgi:hypothetical protein
MWIHYWHTQTQIWIEIAMTDGKTKLRLIIILGVDPLMKGDGQKRFMKWIWMVLLWKT